MELSEACLYCLRTEPLNFAGELEYSHDKDRKLYILFYFMKFDLRIKAFKMERVVA